MQQSSSTAIFPSFFKTPVEQWTRLVKSNSKDIHRILLKNSRILEDEVAIERISDLQQLRADANALSQVLENIREIKGIIDGGESDESSYRDVLRKRQIFFDALNLKEMNYQTPFAAEGWPSKEEIDQSEDHLLDALIASFLFKTECFGTAKSMGDTEYIRHLVDSGVLRLVQPILVSLREHQLSDLLKWVKKNRQKLKKEGKMVIEYATHAQIIVELVRQDLHDVALEYARGVLPSLDQSFMRERKVVQGTGHTNIQLPSAKDLISLILWFGPTYDDFHDDSIDPPFKMNLFVHNRYNWLFSEDRWKSLESLFVDSLMTIFGKSSSNDLANIIALGIAEAKDQYCVEASYSRSRSESKKRFAKMRRSRRVSDLNAKRRIHGGGKYVDIFEAVCKELSDDDDDDDDDDSGAESPPPLVYSDDDADISTCYFVESADEDEDEDDSSNISRVSNCPTCDPIINRLGQNIPPALRSKSIVVCRCCNELVAQNNNELMLLPNGQIFCGKCVKNVLTDQYGTVRCPITRELFHRDSIRQVFLSM